MAPPLVHRSCLIGGCPEYVVAKGYCNRHYLQLRNGSTRKIAYPSSRATTKSYARFQKLFVVGTASDHRPDLGSCWLGKAVVRRDGYWQFWLNGKHVYAHRFSYEHHKGSIPDGLDIDHLCRRRHCVNPDHLEAVTTQVNLLRGLTIQAFNAAKTHCKRGHAFDAMNTFRRPDGSRKCRKCDVVRYHLRRNNPAIRCQGLLRGRLVADSNSDTGIARPTSKETIPDGQIHPGGSRRAASPWLATEERLLQGGLGEGGVQDSQPEGDRGLPSLRPGFDPATERYANRSPTGLALYPRTAFGRWRAS